MEKTVSIDDGIVCFRRRFISLLTTIAVNAFKIPGNGCHEFGAAGDTKDTLFNAFWYGRPISIKVRALNYDYRIVKYSKNNINIFDSKIYIKVIIYTEALYNLACHSVDIELY